MPAYKVEFLAAPYPPSYPSPHTNIPDQAPPARKCLPERGLHGNAPNSHLRKGDQHEQQQVAVHKFQVVSAWPRVLGMRSDEVPSLGAAPAQAGAAQTGAAQTGAAQTGAAQAAPLTPGVASLAPEAPSEASLGANELCSSEAAVESTLLREVSS